MAEASDGSVVVVVVVVVVLTALSTDVARPSGLAIGPSKFTFWSTAARRRIELDGVQCFLRR
jgi:hypothetical protein